MLTCKGSEQQDGSSDYAFPETQNRSLAGSSTAQKRKANRDVRKRIPSTAKRFEDFRARVWHLPPRLRSATAESEDGGALLC
jgi:hypothetical protein